MRGVVLVAVVVAVLASHMRSSTATVERAVVLLLSMLMLIGVEDAESDIMKGFVGCKVWRYRDGDSVRGGA